ncbi:MAG TPA: HDIG domain-containing protein [Methanoregulaceae archaeon]|nr:HDIG domain-containing protein [Methanoregulaceae archaeon]
MRKADDLSMYTILHRAGCTPGVINHCHAVTLLADEYAARMDIADTALVHQAALLHDIGRGRTHSLAHAQAGGQICRELGLPESLARIVERHIGAGLTADECSIERLLPIDCFPASLEEKIVANADNLVRGKTRISIFNRLMSSVSLPRRVKMRMYHLWLEMEQWA